MRTEQVRVLAAYNAWMNDKLYAACATVPEEERKRDRGAFFSSIHGTLNHLLLADLIWLGRFHGKPYPVRSLDQELYPDFADLRSVREATDETIASWAGGLTEERLAARLEFTSGITKKTYAPPLWKLALHFFNHQTHHRGQLTTLLHQTGIDYGVTDLMMLPGFMDR